MNGSDKLASLRNNTGMPRSPKERDHEGEEPLLADVPGEEPSHDVVSEALIKRSRQISSVVPATRFRDIDEREVLNDSQMLGRPSIFVRLMSHWLFRRILFREKSLATIRQAHREGTVVYALNHHSLLDYLYFNYAFRRFGLPMVYFANKISLGAFRPLWRICGRAIRRLLGRLSRKLTETQLLAYGLERERPALLFMKKRGFWPWAPAEDAVHPFLRTVVVMFEVGRFSRAVLMDVVIIARLS